MEFCFLRNKKAASGGMSRPPGSNPLPPTPAPPSGRFWGDNRGAAPPSHHDAKPRRMRSESAMAEQSTRDSCSRFLFFVAVAIPILSGACWCHPNPIRIGGSRSTPLLRLMVDAPLLHHCYRSSLRLRLIGSRPRHSINFLIV